MMKWISRCVVVLAVLTLLLQGANWLARRSLVLPPVPEPNGYVELLKAAAVVEESSRGIVELSDDEIRSLTERNEPALLRARSVLAMESGVPVMAQQEWIEQHQAELGKFKRLATAFGAAGRVALLDGNTNLAVRAHLDVIRLGQAVSCGGLMLDAMVGLALEASGAAGLHAMVSQLSAEECKSTLRLVEELDATRQTAERILETERRWAKQTFGLIQQLGGLLMRKTLAKAAERFKSRHDESGARIRRLMVRLAARAYELETGLRPSKPADLVPRYLKSVPIDLKTGAEMTSLPGSEEVQVRR